MTPSSDFVHERFLSPKDLAARWGCSTEKLKRMRRAGQLTAHYFGRSCRYRLSQVLEREQEAGAVSEPVR